MRRERNSRKSNLDDERLERIERIKNRGKKNKKKKKKRSFFKILFTILLFLVVGFFILMGTGIMSPSELLEPLHRESGRVNALLLGVDEDGYRTDTMMIASFDLDTAELDLLSIPRDTKVYVKNRNQNKKINEIHAIGTKKQDGTILGPVGAAEVVSQITGIPINYYIEFSFDAVENVFETLGSITYDVPDVEGGGRGMNYEDPYQGLFIHLKPGVQELSGSQVLQFMRYRKGDGELQRRQRQQGIIKAMIEQKLNLSLILKIPKIFSSIKDDLKTNLTVSDVAKYSKYLGDLTADKVSSHQLPGEDKYTGGKWYFIQDIEKTKEMVSAWGFSGENISSTVTVEHDIKGVRPAPSKVPYYITHPIESTKPVSTPKPSPKPTPENNYISLD